MVGGAEGEGGMEGWRDGMCIVRPYMNIMEK